MSYLNDRVADSVQQTAETFRQQAQAGWNTIRNDPTLSAAGRQAAMARVAVKLYQQMDGLQNASTGQMAATREDALRRAFGSPSADPTAAISARDAADRASRLGPDDFQEASDLLARANLNFDEVLAAAIGYRAYELTGGASGLAFGGQGWNDVLAAYVDGRPLAAAALGDLQSTIVNQPQSGSVFAFMVFLPNELGGLERFQIEALAAQ